MTRGMMVMMDCPSAAPVHDHDDQELGLSDDALTKAVMMMVVMMMVVMMMMMMEWP